MADNMGLILVSIESAAVCVLVGIVLALGQIRKTLNEIRDLTAELVKRQGRNHE
jgi:hypothetical protein